MKIHILFRFRNGAEGGGGNQFLKVLKNYFIRQTCYTDNIELADVILYNSHQCIDSLLKIKRRHSNKVIVQRIDGPMGLYNKKGDFRDVVAKKSSNYLADGTIFQSSWSKIENYKNRLIPTKFETEILNAPDPEYFNSTQLRILPKEGKIRLIATSWSSNFNKGFLIYKWLDQNLDFNKFEMVFIGNSPIPFSNILIIPPLPKKELAEWLKRSHIFITASKKDPCSNSLIEALHCGLPAVVCNDGGHPEIIQKAGKCFNNAEEIPDLLNLIITDYHYFCNNIQLPNIDAVGKKYCDFFDSIVKDTNEKKYLVKKCSIYTFFKMKTFLSLWKMDTKIEEVVEYIKRILNNLVPNNYT